MVNLPTLDDTTFFKIGSGILGFAIINAFNQVFWKNHTISHATRFIGNSGTGIAVILAIAYLTQGVFCILNEKFRAVTDEEKNKLVNLKFSSAGQSAMWSGICLVSQIALATLAIA